MVREGFTMKRNSNESKRHRSQKLRFKKYLEKQTVSCSMASKALKIAQKCCTRYKRDLEKNSQLWQVKKAKCKITGHIVWFLSCNPNCKHHDIQLTLF